MKSNPSFWLCTSLKELLIQNQNLVFDLAQVYYSYNYFRVWISTSSIRISIILKSKPSFWLIDLLTVITILEFEFAQVH